MFNELFTQPFFKCLTLYDKSNNNNLLIHFYPQFPLHWIRLWYIC